MVKFNVSQQSGNRWVVNLLKAKYTNLKQQPIKVSNISLDRLSADQAEGLFLLGTEVPIMKDYTQTGIGITGLSWVYQDQLEPCSAQRIQPQVQDLPKVGSITVDNGAMPEILVHQKNCHHCSPFATDCPTGMKCDYSNEAIWDYTVANTTLQCGGRDLVPRSGMCGGKAVTSGWGPWGWGDQFVSGYAFGMVFPVGTFRSTHHHHV